MKPPRIRHGLLILLLAACASADDRPPTPTSAPTTAITPATPGGPAGITLAPDDLVVVEVEMQVFSGRPNPAWALEDSEAAALGELLARAPAGPVSTIEGGLGYAGFAVKAHKLSDGAPVGLRVHDGVIAYDDGGALIFLADPGRALERFLLETGKPRIDPSLYRSIEASFR